MTPPRVLADIRARLGRDDILVSDVGLHKLWIGRLYPAYEPNTTLIANGSPAWVSPFRRPSPPSWSDRRRRWWPSAAMVAS